MLEHPSHVPVVEQEAAHRDHHEQQHERVLHPAHDRLRHHRPEAHLDVAPHVLAGVHRHRDVGDGRLAVLERDPEAVVVRGLDVDVARVAADPDRRDLALARGERVDRALDRVLVFLLDQDRELDRHVLGDALPHALRELDVVAQHAEREVGDEDQEQRERHQPDADAPDRSEEGHHAAPLPRAGRRTRARASRSAVLAVLVVCAVHFGGTPLARSGLGGGANLKNRPTSAQYAADLESQRQESFAPQWAPRPDRDPGCRAGHGPSENFFMFRGPARARRAGSPGGGSPASVPRAPRRRGARRLCGPGLRPRRRRLPLPLRRRGRAPAAGRHGARPVRSSRGSR